MADDEASYEYYYSEDEAAGKSKQAASSSDKKKGKVFFFCCELPFLENAIPCPFRLLGPSCVSFVFVLTACTPAEFLAAGTGSGWWIGKRKRGG